MKPLLLLLLPLPLLAQSRDEKVRNDKDRTEKAAYWIFNDFAKAKAEAKASGKPIVAVLRCVPCEECVKLDDETIDADPEMKKLFDQFVRVRLISTNGLDLSTFQFDTDQSFTVFFLEADGTILGRFGTRSHRTQWVGDVSTKGFAAAMEGALQLHRNLDGVKEGLAGKRGPKPEVATPEQFPSLAAKYKNTIDFTGKVAQSCIHCHQIGDTMKEAAMKKGRLPEHLLFPFPNPKVIGLTFDPDKPGVVASVDRERFQKFADIFIQPGDRLISMSGQPVLSIADVQWALHHPSSEPFVSSAVWSIKNANDKHITTVMKFDRGWRRAEDISWRASSWPLRRAAFGGMKLDSHDSGLEVAHVGAFAPHNVAQKAGMKKGDVITQINGQPAPKRETHAIAWSLLERKKGTPLSLTVRRDGKDIVVSIPLSD